MHDSPGIKGAARGGITVNDVHSRLNATAVAAIVTPRDTDELCAAVRDAAARRLPIAIAGGRHAMGGQQFCEGGVLIDMRGMNALREHDPELRFQSEWWRWYAPMFD